MSRYLCYATENKYQGLHGINHIFVVEEKSMRDAEEDCFEACIELMSSYGDIEEELWEEARFYLDEDEDEENALEELFWDRQCENACVQVWEIDEEKAKNLSTSELSTIAYNKGCEDFLEEYCIQED